MLPVYLGSCLTLAMLEAKSLRVPMCILTMQGAGHQCAPVLILTKFEIALLHAHVQIYTVTNVADKQIVEGKLFYLPIKCGNPKPKLCVVLVLSVARKNMMTEGSQNQNFKTHF